MISIILSSACGFLSSGVSNGYGGSLAGDWLQINVLLVLAILTITGIIYALSNLLPTRTGERLRSIARYEIFEAFVSIIIIFAVMALSDSMCNFGAAMSNSQNYTGTFETDELYVGGLLFSKGTAIVSQIYSTAIQYAIAETLISYVVSGIVGFVNNNLLPAIPNLGTVPIAIPSPDFFGMSCLP